MLHNELLWQEFCRKNSEPLKIKIIDFWWLSRNWQKQLFLALTPVAIHLQKSSDCIWMFGFEHNSLFQQVNGVNPVWREHALDTQARHTGDGLSATVSDREDANWRRLLIWQLSLSPSISYHRRISLKFRNHLEPLETVEKTKHEKNQ